MVPPPKNTIKVKRDPYTGEWRYSARIDRVLSTGFAGPASMSEASAHENVQVALYGDVLWPQTEESRREAQYRNQPNQPIDRYEQEARDWEEGEFYEEPLENIRPEDVDLDFLDEDDGSGELGFFFGNKK